MDFTLSMEGSAFAFIFLVEYLRILFRRIILQVKLSVATADKGPTNALPDKGKKDTGTYLTLKNITWVVKLDVDKRIPITKTIVS